MAAPVAATIVTPDDAGNTGKEMRTQTRLVGADTVHEQFVVPSHDMKITGRYWFSSDQQSVVASATNGTSTGLFWLQLPTSATVSAVLRSIRINFSTSATTTSPTAPTVDFTKFTFTGTASGSSVTVLPYVTGGTANQMIVRSAVTGMTVSLVKAVASAEVPAMVGTMASVYGGAWELYQSNESYRRGSNLEFAAGEGLVIYQAVNGTSSDPRRFTVQVVWDEIDLT